MNQFAKKYIQPDRDLLNWEKWVKVREEEILTIGQRIQRPPIDMVMNLHEKVREDKEMKSMLQDAQVKERATVRGEPWEQPVRLKQRCYCEPVYEAHRKPEDIGRPRIIEHIGVPRFILENEKNVHGISERDKCVRLNKEYQKYKQKREDQYKEKIKKMDPYRSDISELFVKGNRPKPPSKPLPPLPEIKISTVDEYEETFTVHAVRINNTVFVKESAEQHLMSELHNMQEEKWHESCTSWSYYFNVPKSRVGRAKLFLQNLGTVTLRYCWKKIRQQTPFIQEEVTSQVFFFNKNEDILSPGQTREVYFTFVSCDIGLYRELWELSFCNVSFFENLTQKFVINLQADTIEDTEKIRRKVDILKVRLNRKAIRKLIRGLLNYVFNKVTSVEPQIYPYQKFLLESEIFLMKNPVCFYHQSEVMKLKESYSQMKPGEVWDLSIASWRKAMMKKDFVERMQYFGMLKQSQNILLKPWQEDESLLALKHSAVKLILSRLADKFDQVYADLNLNSNGNDTEVEEDSDDKLLERMIFYIRMRDHVGMAVEYCAGVVRSLDLNRWIPFDFCQ
ncbi:MYCBP-associated protein [Papilio machaon]|uniref:MYCBP-associated protein n=1 Tax=Papilio machaon TaxID=76193 RepID=A0A194QKA4_PAPMA|nr:MYCBP-associated protein [Papilio machaon]